MVYFTVIVVIIIIMQVKAEKIYFMAKSLVIFILKNKISITELETMK